MTVVMLKSNIMDLSALDLVIAIYASVFGVFIWLVQRFVKYVDQLREVVNELKAEVKLLNQYNKNFERDIDDIKHRINEIEQSIDDIIERIIKLEL